MGMFMAKNKGKSKLVKKKLLVKCYTNSEKGRMSELEIVLWAFRSSSVLQVIKKISLVSELSMNKNTTRISSWHIFGRDKLPKSASDQWMNYIKMI